MDYLTYSAKLEYLQLLVEKRIAKNSKLLAARLRVSESTVKRMIACLRRQGVGIYYCSRRKTYLIE